MSFLLRSGMGCQEILGLIPTITTIADSQTVRDLKSQIQRMGKSHVRVNLISKLKKGVSIWAGIPYNRKKVDHVVLLTFRAVA
jgi:hypothetical protein